MGSPPLPDGALLRPARTTDLEAIRALLRDARLPLDGLEDQFGDGYVVAARPEGRIVAAAGMEVHGGDGLLRSVVVAPPLRGLGLGEALVRDRLRWARGRGLRSVWLLTTTAGPFFDRLGFVRDLRAGAPAAMQSSTEFSSACPASAACFRLDLGAE